jgi:DUF1365 family protein
MDGESCQAGSGCGIVMLKHLFQPPADALSLYEGEVMHARMKPFAHRFTYQVFSTLIDLDRLNEVDRLSPLFSVNRFNLMSFNTKDHGVRDGSHPRAHIERLLAEKNIQAPARILLLCYPRILGFTFNPLAVYYCYDADGGLTALIYEVRNTFGGMHPYVLSIKDGSFDERGVHQEQSKLFYVSPFMQMNMRYRFRMVPPCERVAIRIIENDQQGPILSATFNGTYKAASTATLASAWARIPFLTFKVIAAIHWQALKLWLKGAKYIPEEPSNPGEPATSSRGK